MNVELRPVPSEEREVLANLLEKYDYEFSQYNNRDVNQLGLYGYPYLDYYWNEKSRWAYFIEVDGKPAGFVMVNDYHEPGEREVNFKIAEFFVMFKYRCAGVGRQAFFKTLDTHRGRWQLVCHPKNTASVHFWSKTIDEYTKGSYELVEAYSFCKYEDGSLANAFFFSS